MERTKSIVLALLVAASLFQSYYLAYSWPKFDTVNQGDYVPSELNGTQAELTDLVYPEDLVLHFGNKKHTVLPQQHKFYQMIFRDFLQKKRFEGSRRLNSFMTPINWEDIRNNRPGLEVRYREGIPLNLLQHVMQIKEDASAENDAIVRIWIYVNEKDEVKTYFFSESNMAVYESTITDVEPAKIKSAVALGEFLPAYHTDTGEYYLPDEAVMELKYKMTFTSFSPDMLKRSLFTDPAMVRNLQDRDGSQIFTDSKRGLKFKTDKQWFSYSDPLSTPVDSRKDATDNLQSAIQFANQHGGWNGSYRLNGLTPKQATGPQTFLFRQYFDNLPIINTKDELFGYIKVITQKGIVSSYERSLMTLESKGAAKTEETLPGGKELDEMLKNYGKNSNIVSVFPAYRALVSEQAVELVPRWAIELRDGTYEFL